MTALKKIPLKDVDITGGFWRKKQELNAGVTIGAVESRFRETGRFEAFKFNWTEGSDIPKPHYFWDSDIVKWLEGVANVLMKKDDPGLKAKAESLIDLIEQHQDADGYFNIYHTVVEPDMRFRDRNHHELYCLGHMIEAAVAYYNATGSERLINVCDRYIDLVIKAFVTEKTAGFTTPGHEEIELALFKLYGIRKDKKYKDLAMFFIDKRGTAENDAAVWGNGAYAQGHMPVREQREAMGHAVRACYLYAGMADAARETGDKALLDACRALFDDMIKRKMYITGGIGSSHMGEAFTIAYDLPNDTAYNETCASIALALFADRMKEIDFDSKYADAVERELYNGFLAGWSLDGKAFFYENPLEINLADRSRHTSTDDSDRLPITRRQEVFGCSCCPPNVNRFVSNINESIYSVSDDGVYVHQFIQSEAKSVRVSGAEGKKLFVRIPGWCAGYDFSEAFEIRNGYAVIDIVSDEFKVNARFDMTPFFVTANPAVRADAGKAALCRGPVVYCLEGVDNPFDLFDLRVDINFAVSVRENELFGCPTLETGGVISALSHEEAPLYSRLAPAETKRVTARFIPYFAFANREESDMTVWFRTV